MESEPQPQPNPAEVIVEAFGGLTKMGAALGGCPVTTIHSWVRNGRIPSWRRRDIIEAAKRSGITLPAEFANVAA
jgi:hypothetical protein